MTPQHVQRTYLALTLVQTLATSMIWGINTLFLLDAGLTLTETFIANAAFTAGMVLFEIPTGVVADAAGRRTSYLLGAGTLMLTTLAYLYLWSIDAGVVSWVIVSIVIGLGFTFFSGATEAWLTDALKATGHEGSIDYVFGRGQSISGAGMLIGALGGGFLAQIDFSLAYIVRAILLGLVIVIALVRMRDLGHEPVRGLSIRAHVREILKGSIEHGLDNPPVRMFILAAPLGAGVLVWAFYALQPYLLELLDNPAAVFVAGVAAALFGLAQIAGGLAVNRVRGWFSTRTAVISIGIVVSCAAIIGIGLTGWLPVPVGFWVTLGLTVLWAGVGAVSGPVQQAYVNDVIPSSHRATVLSFLSLSGSAGGVLSQPVLGKVADVWSLSVGFLVAGAVGLARLPFILRVRSMRLDADRIPRQTADLP